MEMKIINKIVVVLFSILLPPLVLMTVFMCVWVFENMFMSRGKEITTYYAPQILSDTMTFCYMDGDAYLFFGCDGKCQRSDSSDYIRFRYSRFSSECFYKVDNNDTLYIYNIETNLKEIHCPHYAIKPLTTIKEREQYIRTSWESSTFVLCPYWLFIFDTDARRDPSAYLLRKEQSNGDYRKDTVYVSHHIIKVEE